MPTSFIVGSKRAVVAVAVILIALVAAAAYVIQEQTDIRMQLDRTREAIAQTKEAQVAVVAYEGNYRALLAAPEKGPFYEACYASQSMREMPMTALRSFTARDAATAQLMPEMIDLQHKLTAQPVSLEEFQKMSREQIAQTLLKRQAMMDRHGALCKQLIAAEEEAVSARREQAKVLRELFYTAFAALALGGLGGLWWLYQAIDAYVREKNDAMSALELKSDDLLKARDEAVRANLLKSQFVANISHEIRTPMNGILGLSELLSQSETDADGMAKHIHDSAMNLMTILNDLLDFSKLEAGRMQPNLVEFNTAALLKDVAEFMSVNFAAKGIALETSVDEGLDKELIGDRDRIRQVLLNLIHNALKFTSAGGVTLTSKVEKYYEDEAFVRFEVIDTGIGIDPEAKKKLFEPFVQADMSSTRRHGGTGLGLSISKSLVELMNGSIDCQTEENKGSTFSFVVPLRLKVPAVTRESAKSTP